jgi:hypothetical protein
MEEVVVSPSYYPSNRNGNLAVNASTGVEYDWKVGSRDMHRLYKVTDSSGYYDSRGYLRNKNSVPNYEPNHLYFDSPEQASKHLRMPVNDVLAREWREKVERMFPVNSETQHQQAVFRED